MVEEYYWKQFGMKTKDQFEVLGKPTPRLDGDKRASGRIQFTADVHYPGMLYTKILWCPYARARLVSIDVREAAALPGVVKVLTHEDADPFGVGPATISAGRPLLPKPGDTLLMWGQEVAAVIAESEDIAEDALSLIKVQYEPLPHVLDPEQAMKSDAPQIKPEGNAQKPIVYSRGDVDKGFAASDVIIEVTYRPQRIFNNGLEMRGAVAKWDYDRVTIWARTQGTFQGVMPAIQAVYGVPRNKMSVKFEAHGGSYGSFAGRTSETLLAVLGALKTGKPVRCRYGREEEQTVMHGHGDRVMYIKVGAKRDGKLVAMQVRSIHNNGAFGAGSEVVYEWSDLYKCPNLKVETIPVFTDRHNSGAYRAVSNPHTNYGLESAIDEMAYALGMDPVEFRRLNLAAVDDADQPPREPRRRFSSYAIHEVVQKGADMIGWKAKWHKPGEKTLPNGRKHGIAVALSNDAHGVSGTLGNTFIKLQSDGTVTILSGCIDNGNGTNTWIPMIVAEYLGIPLDKVRGTFADTDATPDHGGSWGSTRTVGSGWGTTLAALDLRKKLTEIAIAKFFPEAKLVPESIVFSGGKVYPKGDPAKAKTFAEVATEAERTLGGPVLGHGYTPPDPPDWLAKYYKTSPRHAQFCEVEVDTETGEIYLTKFVTVHDTGPLMNPLTYENQAQGGSVEGIGGALMEGHIYDKATGAVLNDNWIEFKIPTIKDVPDVEAAAIEHEDRINHHGMKGFAEPPKTMPHALLANAVFNAIGVRIRELPITPDRVLRALKAKGGA